MATIDNDCDGDDDYDDYYDIDDDNADDNTAVVNFPIACNFCGTTKDNLPDDVILAAGPSAHICSDCAQLVLDLKGTTKETTK